MCRTKQWHAAKVSQRVVCATYPPNQEECETLVIAGASEGTTALDRSHQTRPACLP